MKLGNVKTKEIINVFGTLSDIDVYFEVVKNEYMLDYVAEFAQECFDDWMCNDDTCEPIGDYIIRRMKDEHYTELRLIGLVC